jgi:ParB family chromosome partitioning protein
MPDPIAQGVEQILVGDIKVVDRLRPVSEIAIDALEASVKEVGDLIDTIHVRRTNSGDVLIDGAHRLALAQRLQWERIPAKVWRCNKKQARLIEVDTNLAQAELNDLDMALFLAERKRVYEELYPEAKAGVAGAKSRWNDANDIVSFASSVAEARNISQRHVQRMTAVGEALSPDQIAALRDANQPVLQKDLIALSKADPELRAAAIDVFVAGQHKKLAQAVSAVSPKSNAKPAKSAADQAFDALEVAYTRANKPVRRRFVEANAKTLRELLEGIE